MTATKKDKAPAGKTAEAPTVKTATANEKKQDKTYVMLVGHLAWGLNGKNHFYHDRKPLISGKVLGNYKGVLQVWLKAGWIEEGSYFDV